MSKYKHILFDVDGTLVDTYEANISSLIELLDRYVPNHGRGLNDFADIFGLPGVECLKILGVPQDKGQMILKEWIELVHTKSHMCRLYDGVIPLLSILKEQGYHLAVVTSRTRGMPMGGPLGGHIPEPLSPYIERAICANDVKRPKPAPDSILLYMEQTGAKREEILFIGDAHTDLQCANSAGVDFGLAVWDYRGADFLKCAHYFKNVWEILSVLSAKEDDHSLAHQLHNWAREINAIGQIGLTYVKDRFDKERYERLGEIASQMAALYVDEKAEVIKSKWCTEGYKTPQLDTRGAVFNEQGQILLVKEKLSGKWSLPGGWCDENLTIMQNTIKEIREEACMEVCPVKLIAILDKNKHNDPENLAGCLKAFVLCKAGPGHFVDNIETSQRRFFSLDELPTDNLRTSTTSLEQLKMCFAAYETPNWQPIVE